jgi:hypothetical protein
MTKYSEVAKLYQRLDGLDALAHKIIHKAENNMGIITINIAWGKDDSNPLQLPFNDIRAELLDKLEGECDRIKQKIKQLLGESDDIRSSSVEASR